MDEILVRIGISLVCIMAALIIVAASVKIYGEITGSTNCAYCQNTISEHADTVICTDGRRYHAECYMRYIEEGENGKASSETP